MGGRTVEQMAMRNWNLILRKLSLRHLVHMVLATNARLLSFKNPHPLQHLRMQRVAPHLEHSLPRTHNHCETTLILTSMFWQNDSTGINQRPDFWGTIAHNVHIHRQDITSLNPTSIVLSDGNTIPADVLICSTGWRNSLSVFSFAETLRLGLPIPLPSLPPKSAAKWNDLHATADKSILSMFSSLAHPPPHYEPPITHSPYRLYRMLAPTCDPDRSIVFLGHMVVGNNFRAAECQALWATAYLDGNMALPSTEAMEAQVALSNAWNRRRYLGKGIAGNWFYYDLVPYTDLLLREVGVRPRERGWWGRWFAPCVAGDLRGVVEDYRALCR